MVFILKIIFNKYCKCKFLCLSLIVQNISTFYVNLKRRVVFSCVSPEESQTEQLAGLLKYSMHLLKLSVLSGV